MEPFNVSHLGWAYVGGAVYAEDSAMRWVAVVLAAACFALYFGGCL